MLSLIYRTPKKMTRTQRRLFTNKVALRIISWNEINFYKLLQLNLRMFDIADFFFSKFLFELSLCSFNIKEVHRATVAKDTLYILYVHNDVNNFSGGQLVNFPYNQSIMWSWRVFRAKRKHWLDQIVLMYH